MLLIPILNPGLLILSVSSTNAPTWCLYPFPVKWFHFSAPPMKWKSWRIEGHTLNSIINFCQEALIIQDYIIIIIFRVLIQVEREYFIGLLLVVFNDDEPVLTTGWDCPSSWVGTVWTFRWTFWAGTVWTECSHIVGVLGTWSDNLRFWATAPTVWHKR